jgi:hypothetical protein
VESVVFPDSTRRFSKTGQEDATESKAKEPTSSVGQSCAKPTFASVGGAEMEFGSTLGTVKASAENVGPQAIASLGGQLTFLGGERTSVRTPRPCPGNADASA